MSTPAIVRTAVEAAFRDFEVDGLPASGDHDPLKPDIRAALGATLEAALSSIGSGIERYATVALRDAVTDAPDGSLAYVYNNNDDPADPANGVYQWDLATTGWVAAAWYFEAVAAVVQPFVDEAEAWAEGTEPGGPGTKSAMEWALDAAGDAATVAASLINVSELRTNVASRVAGGVYDVEDRLAFAVDIFSGELVGGGVTLLLDRVRAGLTYEMPGEDAHPVCAVNMSLVGGQSLANGYGSRPILSTTQAYDNLMFNGGLYRPATTGLASFTAMVSADDNTHGETILPGLTSTVANSVGGSYPMLGAAWGADSTQIVDLLKGTATYTGLLNTVTAAKAICDADYKSFAVQSLAFIQGESDEASDTSEALYESRLTSLITDFVADAKAATGQTHDPKFMFCQVSSWTHYDQPEPTICLAQLDVYEADPVNRILIGAKYHLEYAPDGVHLTAHSERQWGCYYGKVFYRVVILGEAWGPLRPLTVEQETARSVIATFHVPSGPLVLDTTLVTDPGDYGFQVQDAGGLKTISSVTQLGQDKVRIAFTTDLGASPELHYACAGDPGDESGPITGPRGCLRDSDPTVSLYVDDDGRPYPLFNWCVHFKKAIT